MSGAAQARAGHRPRPLPEGWRWVKLQEVCTPDRQLVDPGSALAKNLPYLSLDDIEPNTGRLLKGPGVGREDEGQSTTFAFDDRHVLYGKLRPYLNKVALPDFAGRCTTELIPLVPAAAQEREFLAWVLRRPGTVEAAMRGKTGSRMPRADLRDLLQLLIPLPPLCEQYRIVAILHEQMAAPENARAAAEVQLEAAKALPAAYLREVFGSPKAQRWATKRLGEVGEIVSGITLGRKVFGSETHLVPYLRVANVRDGRLDLSDLYQIAATGDEVVKLQLRYGDLLLTEGGDPDKLGRGTFWEDQLPLCLHQNHIFRVRFDLTQLSPGFVSAQVSSVFGKKYFLAHAKQTTGIATINQRVLANFPLMMPPRPEQEAVVQQLAGKMEVAESLRRNLQERVAVLNQMSVALLRRAFSGEL